ncbi:hypothetical protein So717_29440 [Roseobacter cerasinus]|uniref:Uncharacterized protein n=1 Tax=Roseobacter cerasinus TaxID=2602289 RepID=A0A640VVS2_9RHOB|nr:hypothetical protein So717_29440 [Roseobacter cerasinus]
MGLDEVTVPGNSSQSSLLKFGHERNVGCAKTKTKLSKYRRYLTAMMSLVIEHMCHQYPLQVELSLKALRL